MPTVFRNRHFWLFVGACTLAMSVLVVGGRPVEEAIAWLLVLGVAFPLLSLGACWRMPVPTPPEAWRPDDGSTMVILVGWVVVFLMVKGPLLEALLPAGAGPALHDTANTLLKLGAFIGVPALVLRAQGFTWRQCGRPTASTARLMLVFVLLAIASVAMQYLLGSQFRRLFSGDYAQRHVLLGLVLTFVWMTLEAGVVEEFFFRWYLQSRLAAWTRSQVSGVFLSSLVFGLAHAPGIWLRGAGVVEGLGDSPSLVTSLAYVVVTQGVAGLMFATLWARTRSFVLVVALHGFMDALANAPSFMDTWGL